MTGVIIAIFVALIGLLIGLGVPLFLKENTTSENIEVKEDSVGLKSSYNPFNEGMTFTKKYAGYNLEANFSAEELNYFYRLVNKNSLWLDIDWDALKLEKKLNEMFIEIKDLFQWDKQFISWSRFTEYSVKKFFRGEYSSKESFINNLSDTINEFTGISEKFTEFSSNLKSTNYLGMELTIEGGCVYSPKHQLLLSASSLLDKDNIINSDNIDKYIEDKMKTIIPSLSVIEEFLDSNIEKFNGKQYKVDLKEEKDLIEITVYSHDKDDFYYEFEKVYISHKELFEKLLQDQPISFLN